MSGPARLPAGIEVSAMVRAAGAAGGFAAVLRRGEQDGGTILVILVDKQGLGTLYERMPQLNGERKWTVTRHQDPDGKQEFNDYLDRRAQQDPDMWIVELTIADGERLILNQT